MNNSEVNRRVAEEVLGWYFDDVCKVWYEVVGGGLSGLPDRKWHHNFNPSENISDAWMVVEKLRKNHRIDVTSWIDGFQCCIIDNDGESCYKDAESAPLAISLAALEAVK